MAVPSPTLVSRLLSHVRQRSVTDKRGLSVTASHVAVSPMLPDAH